MPEPAKWQALTCGDDAPFETIRLAVRDSVARLTLAKPASLNALDPLMLEELLTALDAVGRRSDISCLIVDAEGRTFCAGVDIDTPYFFNGVTDDSVFAGTRLLTEQHRLISAVYDLPQVTVAAVNGDAVGGSGFGLAMACDLRLAVASARFWMIPTRLDVIQDFGLTWLLQQQIGSSHALEIALTGRPVTGEEAERLGFVNTVVPDAESLTVAVETLAERVARSGADSVRMLKVVVRSGRRSELREQLNIEAIANGLTFQSAEFQAKHSAYLTGLARRGSEQRA